MARRWTPQEWEILFTALPPVHERPPSWDQLRKVGHSLNRSPDALLAVWEDGERYLRGATYGEASPRLRAYLQDGR